MPKNWGWYVDPDMKRVHAQGGPPPKGHPRRCQGRQAKSNPPIQCGHWALRGRNYCKFHGGNQPIGIATRIEKDVAIYSRAAGPILKQKLEELANLSPSERHCLGEEIDLARVMAERALKLYDATFFGDKEPSTEIKLAVQKTLKNAVTFVSDLVTKAAKARAIDQSTVDVEQLDFIVKQVTRIIEEEVADYDRPMADRVVNRLREIRMPERQAGAAALSPEDIAQSLKGAHDAIMAGITVDPPEGDDDES